MSRCVRQSNRSVRKRGEQLQCTCPEDRQTKSDELTKSVTCRTDLGANTASADEEEEVLEQSEDSVPVVQMDCAFLHNIGHKGAKVTFLTMQWLRRQSRRRDTTSLLNASCRRVSRVISE